MAGWALGLAASADASPAYLTRAERAQVAELVMTDERILAVVGGAGVHVATVLPWSHDLTRETLIGADVTLEFDEPQTVEADWPLADFEGDDYTVTRVHYRVDNADAITALVDLHERRVVSFDVRDGDVDQSSIRYLDAPVPSLGSRTDVRPNGRANAAFMAAFVLAGVAAVLVAAASRVSSG